MNVLIADMNRLGTDVIFLFLVLHLSATYAVRSPVGEVYYLTKVDVLGEKLFGGAPVLVNITSDCFACQKVEILDDTSSFFQDTGEFYSSITEDYSLGAALKRDFTLGFTLDQTTSHISQSNRTVKGSTLNVVSKSAECIVKPQCIYNEAMHTVSPSFLAEFEKLPRNIQLPGGEFNFSAYEHFLNEFGSHVVTGVTYGSRMYQHCFSTAEENYNARNYTVRACVAFSGGTDVTKTNVSTCAGITEEEATSSMSLDVSTRLVLRGGTKETRAKLYAERTNELIAKFLNESDTEEPVEYSFTAVWSLLGQKYIGTEHYAKVRHLEGYYLGVKNFNCSLIMKEESGGGGWAMQGFAETDYSTADVPSYKCYIPYSGCHEDSDCHYSANIACQCHGDTCFKSETRRLNNGELREYVRPVYDSGWYWQGCHLNFFACSCRNSEAFEWKTIWEQDTDGADNGKMMRSLHSKIDSFRRAASIFSGSDILDSEEKKAMNQKEEL